MQSGIYKVTSPKGKVYIGQSIDLEKRFRRYENLKCERQVKLYNSFLKYGWINHTFEVIELCDTELLNEKERYWQDYYDVLNKGLNCNLTDTDTKSGKVSDETKKKISDTHKRLGINKGKKISEETREKRSISLRGRVVTDETKARMSLAKRNPTDETRKRISLSAIEKYKKMSNPHNKLVLNLETGIFYDSLLEAATAHNIARSTLSLYLSGKLKNKTTLIKV